MRHTLYTAVREMLERHWDVYQIAAKLKIDPATVQVVIDMINNLT